MMKPPTEAAIPIIAPVLSPEPPPDDGASDGDGDPVAPAWPVAACCPVAAAAPPPLSMLTIQDQKGVMGQHTLLPCSSRRRLGCRRWHRRHLKPVRQAVRIVDADSRGDIPVRTAGGAIRARTGADVLGCGRPEIGAAEALVLLRPAASELADQVDAAVLRQAVSCALPHCLERCFASDREDDG